MRGRNRPKGPNPLTRSYESNGPDVKIRGTAQHIADKYAQLARDALAAGDPVAAENYFQHGEHYFRIVSGAQDQNRPANTGGYASRPYDDDMEDGDDDGQGSGGSQNGHGYNGYDDNDPGQQPQPYESRPDGNQDGRQGRDRFQNRDQRRFDNNGRQDYRRQDQPRQDYQRQDYQRQDYRQENRQENRQDRQDYGRPDFRPERHEGRQDRQDRPARVALTGLTIAEQFRDDGQDVLFFVDNIFRFTQAGSEVSALLGRIPSAVGYQPTLATDMGALQERITTRRRRSWRPRSRRACRPS
ncbi:DUF4167 domain-containing protein [Methylobacterium oryzae]|uniref:DUF4167 domain-containing protein n=1 Tax=Methylobacterium oryzae TaxID=334852 RepID=UPI002F3540FB